MTFQRYNAKILTLQQTHLQVRWTSVRRNDVTMTSFLALLRTQPSIGISMVFKPDFHPVGSRNHANGSSFFTFLRTYPQPSTRQHHITSHTHTLTHPPNKGTTHQITHAPGLVPGLTPWLLLPPAQGFNNEQRKTKANKCVHATPVHTTPVHSLPLLLLLLLLLLLMCSPTVRMLTPHPRRNPHSHRLSPHMYPPWSPVKTRSGSRLWHWPARTRHAYLRALHFHEYTYFPLSDIWSSCSFFSAKTSNSSYTNYINCPDLCFGIFAVDPFHWLLLLFSSGSRVLWVLCHIFLYEIFIILLGGYWENCWKFVYKVIFIWGSFSAILLLVDVDNGKTFFDRLQGGGKCFVMKWKVVWWIIFTHSLSCCRYCNTWSIASCWLHCPWFCMCLVCTSKATTPLTVHICTSH